MFCFRKSTNTHTHTKKTTTHHALFKFLLGTGQYLAECNLVQMAIYYRWQPVPKTMNPHYFLNCVNMVLKYTDFVGFKHFVLSYTPLTPNTLSTISTNYFGKVSILRIMKIYNSYLGHKPHLEIFLFFLFNKTPVNKSCKQSGFDSKAYRLEITNIWKSSGRSHVRISRASVGKIQSLCWQQRLSTSHTHPPNVKDKLNFHNS